MLRAAIGVILLCTAGPALADQHDPRLPGLFDQLKKAPDVAAAGQLEGEIWEIWGETDNAEAAALLASGAESMAQRAWPSALQSFDRLVAIAPDFAEGWNKRATLYYLMHDYDRSVADIQRTLALEPHHFGALSGMALIFMAVDKPEAAIHSFEAGLAIHPFLMGAKQHIEALRQQLGGEQL